MEHGSRSIDSLKVVVDCDGVLLDWAYAFDVWMLEQGYKRIFDTDNRSTDELPLPIAGISPNGFNAVSYSFNRMKSRLCPTAYGYANGEEHDVDKNVSPSETLKLVNISNGKIIPLLKLLRPWIFWIINRSFDRICRISLVNLDK